MEYEIERAVCKKCSGEVKCTQVCEIHTCKALVNYLRNVDVSETKIGEFGSKNYGGKQDLVVSGHQLYGLKMDTGSILTGINTTLDATKKFQSSYDTSIVQMLNMSREQLDLSIEDAQNIVNMISKLNTNKLVLVPFKPETVCIVSTPKAYQSHMDATVKTITWRTNKDTHKLEATLKFDFNRNSGESCVAYKMSEYMEKFKVKAMNLSDKGEKRDESLIKMTDYGIIQPIEVVNKETRIIVDGTYIYCATNNGERIIGAWNPNNDLIIIENIKSKAITKIKENLSLLRGHRRYIAPYMLHETNIIEV